jgi:hypothetical protein
MVDGKCSMVEAVDGCQFAEAWLIEQLIIINCRIYPYLLSPPFRIQRLPVIFGLHTAEAFVIDHPASTIRHGALKTHY